MFDISIIVPVYNTNDLIERCIVPILELNDDTIELICVNDGSKDHSLEILKNIQLKYERMIIVDQKNGGLSNARNNGLKVAKGKYILFLDSDDWLDLEEFFKLKAYCKEDYEIIHGNFNYTYDDKASIRNKLQYEGVLSGQDFLSTALLTNQFSMPVWINLYKRSFLLNHHLLFMEGIYHEDEEFNPRAFSLAKSVMSKNIYFYSYYQRPNSITNNGSNEERRFLDILKISESISDFIESCSFNREYTRVIQTYLALLIISGYIRIHNKEIASKYYPMMKEMRLYQQIYSKKTPFRVVSLMLKYCPHLFFKIYRQYFDLTSKKV
ncbi:MAG: glycosyltransferase [Turicibacter sp.]|nr:glycosyltransferase [Turicibacter sp.]